MCRPSRQFKRANQADSHAQLPTWIVASEGSTKYTAGTSGMGWRSASSSMCSVTPWRRSSFTLSSGASTSLVYLSSISTLYTSSSPALRLGVELKCSIRTTVSAAHAAGGDARWWAGSLSPCPPSPCPPAPISGPHLLVSAAHSEPWRLPLSPPCHRLQHSVLSLRLASAVSAPAPRLQPLISEAGRPLQNSVALAPDRAGADECRSY